MEYFLLQGFESTVLRLVRPSHLTTSAPTCQANLGLHAYLNLCGLLIDLRWRQVQSSPVQQDLGGLHQLKLKRV
jgi:hypothetical protein